MHMQRSSEGFKGRTHALTAEHKLRQGRTHAGARKSPVSAVSAAVKTSSFVRGKASKAFVEHCTARRICLSTAQAVSRAHARRVEEESRQSCERGCQDLLVCA